MFRFVTVVGMLGGVASAMAEPVRMTGDDIKSVMVPGTQLAIDTPIGTSIPVTISPGGLVSGDAGALGLTLGSVKDRGRWWTDGDKLCMKWFRWFDAKPRCMTLTRDGNRVHWYEGSGESGTATLTVAAPTVVVAAPAPAPRRLAKAPAPPAAEPLVETVAAERAPPTDSDGPQARFATAALTDMLEAESRADDAAKLGAAPTPPKPQAPQRQHAETKRTVPAPAAKPQAAKRERTAAASVRVPKEPYRHEPLFRVSGVDIGDKLNVRSGPSEYHAAVGAIPADARKVRITGTCRELWCPVRHGRLEGWVNRYYLAEDVAAQSTASSRR
jgi:hypothetical protein